MSYVPWSNCRTLKDVEGMCGAEVWIGVSWRHSGWIAWPILEAPGRRQAETELNHLFSSGSVGRILLSFPTRKAMADAGKISDFDTRIAYLPNDPAPGCSTAPDTAACASKWYARDFLYLTDQAHVLRACRWATDDNNLSLHVTWGPDTSMEFTFTGASPANRSVALRSHSAHRRGRGDVRLYLDRGCRGPRLRRLASGGRR